MKRILSIGISLFLFGPAAQVSGASLPPVGGYKVAYYVFDSGGPDHFPLTTFTDKANIVILFEGTAWELADSVHYANGYIITTNVNYHYYSEIIRDVRVLQARGVKVLMNVDDAASWSTSTPFTTYDGRKLDYQQFAAFIKACVIDSLHLDGISLDIEHGATGNAAYISLIKEIGKYFGPMSSNSTSEIYTAAIYAGGRPGSVIGKSKDVAAYLNFIMDMAYFSSNYAARFTQWADSIGSSKTMIGVLNDYYDLSTATAAAAWQPSGSSKAGIMVYAANNLKSYTDAVFDALPVPQTFVLMQNYPNPFNPTTIISYRLPAAAHISLKIYDILGREVETLVNETQGAGDHSVRFTGYRLSSGVYFYRLIYPGVSQTKKMTLLR